MRRVSKHAREVLKLYENIITFKESCVNDGFDYIGPKSYIYDLYIKYERDSQIYVDNWHWEQWFHVGEPDGYIEENNRRTFTLVEFNKLRWAPEL